MMIHYLLFFMFTTLFSAEIVINLPGIVQLGSTINFAPLVSNDTAVSITADNVILDLGGKVIAHANAALNTVGVRIATGVSNVVIRNGLIKDFTGDAITIESDCQNVTVENLVLKNCARGVGFNGSGAQPVTLSMVNEVSVLQTTTGIGASFLNCSTIENCSVVSSAQFGIDLVSSQSNCVSENLIQCLTTAGSGAGISLASGSSNFIQSNNINDVVSTAGIASDIVSGISLNASEQFDTLLDNQVSNILSTGLSAAYGIASLYDEAPVTALDSATLAGVVVKMDWSFDDQYLAVASGTTVQIYNVVDGNLIFITSATHGAAVNAVAWSPDRSYLAIAGAASGGVTFRVYSFNGTSLGTPTNFAGAATTSERIAWSPDGTFIVLPTGSTALPIRLFIFDRTTPALVEFDNAVFAPVSAGDCASFSPDGRFFTVTSADGRFFVYEIETTTITQVDSATLAGATDTSAIAFSPDGRYIAVGSDNDLVEVYGFDGTNISAQIASFDYGSSVQDLSWSQDGRRIAVAGAGAGDGLLIVSFNGSDLTLVSRTTGLGGGSEGVQFSPSGRYIAFGIETGAIPNILLRAGFVFGAGNRIVNNVVTDVMHPNSGSNEEVGGVGINVSSGTNLAVGNSSYNSDINYAYVALELFRSGIVNAQLRNQFANKLSNVSCPC